MNSRKLVGFRDAIWCRLVAAVTLVSLFLDFLGPPPATAQEQAGNFDIYVYVCSEDPGEVGLASTPDPAKCRGQDGVEVAVATEDGDPIGTCITGAVRPGGGSCSLRVHVDAAIVTENVATIPPGYAPRENPRRSPVYGEFSGAVFVNLPIEATSATPRLPTDVPNTGSGTTTHGADRVLFAMAFLALAGLATRFARRCSSFRHVMPES